MLYYFYKLCEVVFNFLPLAAGYWLAERLADLKYIFSKKDKVIILNNLRLIFGKDNPDLERHVRDVFRYFCKYLVDFIRHEKIDKPYIDRNVKLKGIENLNDAFKNKNGVILLSAHLGNWELGAMALGLLGYPINVIALTHKDKRINDFFDNRRKSKGVGVIPLGGSVKKAFKALDRNEGVAILADRDFSKSDLRVKFFGRDTIMPKGAAIFKLRKNCSIVPLFMMREPDNTFTYSFEKAIEYTPVGKEHIDIKAITEKCLKPVEEYVKKYPGQWSMFSELWPEE